jgi:hypothetical protein
MVAGGGKKRWNLNRQYSGTCADKTEAEPSGARAVDIASEISPEGKVLLAPSQWEQPVHPAQHKIMAPPAGSYLTRGGPGGLYRYVQTGYLLLEYPA